MKKIDKWPRQGDILFVEAPPIDQAGMSDWRLREREKSLRKDGIVQEGEATGHHHRLETLTDAFVYRPQWGEAAEVQVKDRGATFVHPEHGPVKLKPNTRYFVHRAREHDILGNTRYVAD